MSDRADYTKDLLSPGTTKTDDFYADMMQEYKRVRFRPTVAKIMRSLDKIRRERKYITRKEKNEWVEKLDAAKSY